MATNLIPYVIANSETGRVTGCGYAQPSDISSLLVPAGCSIHRISGCDLAKRQRVVVAEGVESLIDVGDEPATDSVRRNALLARLAERRWEIETGGFTFRGMHVKSDADSQAKINGLIAAIEVVGPGFSTAWKCTDGWIQLDEAGARELVAAGVAHVSRCFVRERELSAAITSASEEDLPAIAEVVEAFRP